MIVWFSVVLNELISTATDNSTPCIVHVVIFKVTVTCISRHMIVVTISLTTIIP